MDANPSIVMYVGDITYGTTRFFTMRSWGSRNILMLIVKSCCINYHFMLHLRVNQPLNFSHPYLFLVVSWLSCNLTSNISPSQIFEHLVTMWSNMFNHTIIMTTNSFLLMLLYFKRCLSFSLHTYLFSDLAMCHMKWALCFSISGHATLWSITI